MPGPLGGQGGPPSHDVLPPASTGPDYLYNPNQHNIFFPPCLLQAAEAGGALVVGEDGTAVLEKVVQVPKALDPETMAAMRAEMEANLKRQLLRGRLSSDGDGNEEAARQRLEAALTPEEIERVGGAWLFMGGWGKGAL